MKLNRGPKECHNLQRANLLLIQACNTKTNPKLTLNKLLPSWSASGLKLVLQDCDAHQAIIQVF